MTKSRQHVLLNALNGKCTLGRELARQLLSELDAFGSFTYSANSGRYHDTSGKFVALALVQAWTTQRAIKVANFISLATGRAVPPHALYEAHVAMKDDTPIRATATPSEQRHESDVKAWWTPRVWDSEEEGQAQHDYIQTTME